MAVSLTHAFVSGKPASNDNTLVDGPKWDAEHSLTLATDKLLGRVSANTGAVEEVTCTDFAQSLLDDVDAATARATLGVTIGTNVQAWDADLDAIAALTRTRGDLIVGGAAGWTDLALGTSGQYLRSDGTDAIWAALSLNNGVWFTGRNQANNADLNMFRVNSDNFTEWSNPLYYSDGAFVNRNAKMTVAANTASPTGIFPGVYVLHEGKGDNATFIGVAAGYFQARDRTDVTALNKGVLYSLHVDVHPLTARGSSSPNDDAVALAISNSGTAKATEAIYIGDNAMIVGSEFATVIQIDCDADDVLNASGAYANGIDFVTGGPATFTGSAIRLPNNEPISYRNAANDADLGIIHVDASNLLQLGTGAHVVIPTSLTLPNAGLHLLDTNATHDLIVAPGSNLTADRTLTVTTGDADRTLTISGNATVSQDYSSTGSPTFANPVVTSITTANTGLHILDTNASHDLILAPGSDLSADRTLSLVTGDAARTITLSGDPTLSDWFDQSVKTSASPTFVSETLTGGLRVGFAGSPTADRIEIGDANFSLDLDVSSAGSTSIVFDSGGDALLFSRSVDQLRMFIGGVERFSFDDTATAGQTAFSIYDVDNNNLERVTVGAADSGGAGFKVLRIPN